MSIKVMKMALEALENASPAAWASRVDSDTMKSIWRKHAEALEGLQVLLAELDNASCKSVQKRLEARQPATAIACGIPGMAKTTCPYCEQGFAFEHEQPATSEPVVSRNPFASRCYTMSESHLSGHRLIVGFEKLVDAQDAHEWVTRQGRGDFTYPAPSVPDDMVRDAERYRYLRDIRRRDAIVLSGPEAGVWCDAEDEDGTLLLLTEDDLDAAIDAAMLAAKEPK